MASKANCRKVQDGCTKVFLSFSSSIVTVILCPLNLLLSHCKWGGYDS